MAQETTEGVDLQQLAGFIKGGFASLFRGVLRTFLYLKKRAIILCILVVLGAAAGWGLTQWMGKEYKMELIVQPNLKSKNYLYDAIAEIEANLRIRNYTFFLEAGIEQADIPDLRVEVAPASEDTETLRNKDYLRYLELLEKFQNDPTIGEVIQEEVLDKTGLSHRITFTFRDTEKGPLFVRKLVDYLNANPYFSQLIEVNRLNNMDRITSNEALIAQIDSLLTNYSEDLGRASALEGGQLLLDAGQAMDPANLIQIKSSLLRDNENRRYNLARETRPIEVLNLGHVQPIRQGLLNSYLFQVPLLLLVLFFLADALRYVNKKAGEL